MRPSLLLLFSAAIHLGCGSAPFSGTGERAATSAASAPVAKGSGVSAGTLTAGIWDDSLNFDRFTAFRDAQSSPLVDFTAAEQQAAAGASRTATTALDIAVVIDTTGSMSDEIKWLKAEVAALSADVATTHPGAQQRWALVHYRDDGDQYVVRHDDFTANLSDYRSSLSPLAAGGGGDFPEAPERALAQAAQLSWSSAPSTAKLVFWIADAPPHDDDVAPFSAAVRALRDRGVHVYPVASSGIDERTEYAMRASAQLTMGRYLFLTDDSGVGAAHKEPSIPCYVVTKLNHAVERVIASELAGTRVEVDPAKVIRTAGNPEQGRCALGNGAVAHLF
ncbi:MAG: VWA domain-containing protein [Myxococcaceae bacterium]|nr:VWA domain-containing protein [Myxococcaceae bacterium]